MKQSLDFSQEELDQERWELISWSDGTYYISNLGRVKRKYGNYERILKPYFRPSRNQKSSNKKTLYIKIFTSEGFKVVQVHKLVAEYFLQPQPSPKHVLNHKNGVISDNRDINLRWITRSESGKIGALKTSKVKGIVKIDPVTNEIIDFYKSSREAAKKNFCSYQTILDSCNKRTNKNCTGFIFQWDGDRFYG